MAKYSIDYACGHGSFEEQLFGPGKDRERKIEWLGSNKVCPDCYKSKMQAQRQAEQFSAEVIFNAFSGGVWLAITKGDTYSIKDALKSIGCRWREYSANTDILGMRAPKKSWMLFVAKTPEAEGFATTLQAAFDLLAKHGIAIAKLDESPFAAMSYIVAANLAKKEIKHA
jgi:hypothetical protein